VQAGVESEESGTIVMIQGAHLGLENKTKPKLRDSTVLQREATHVGQRAQVGHQFHILSMRDYLS